MSRIVVVSNRIGPIEEGKAAPGGLAVGVFEILRATGGVWFGWSGDVVDHTPQTPNLVQQGNITYATVGLGKKDYNEYYAGFSNATLWPLLHYRTGLIDFNRDSLAGYLRVNEQFAEHLARLIQPSDIIWIHDYHLIPLAAALRRRGITQRIGFFLHTPLPPRAVMRTLPDHRQIFGTFSAYDVVGFQTPDDADHFSDYMVRELGASRQGTTLALDARLFKAGSFPIGIDPEEFSRTAAVAVGQAATRRLVKSLGERPLVIGVDRLDYSKGLPFRFKAIEHLLGHHPEWRNRCTFLQVATLSRQDVKQYKQLRDELDAAAGHINGRYADYDWTPIRYVNRSFNRNTLAGFFRHARVGLVTPLRDGMNLVAKEYVAAQRPEDPGVLILSQFAGAANELDTALLVNPFDVGGVAQTIIRALEMSLPERAERWRAMMATLRHNTVRDWARRFVETLTANRADMRPAALSGTRPSA